MNKIFLFLLLLCTSCTREEWTEINLAFTHQDNIVRTYMSSQKIPGTDDPIYYIKLKCVNREADYSGYRIKVAISYVIDIIYPMPSTSHIIKIKLLDQDGFQIEEALVANVVPDYFGTLKGELSMYEETWKKVCDAELDYYVH